MLSVSPVARAVLAARFIFGRRFAFSVFGLAGFSVAGFDDLADLRALRFIA